MNEVPMEECPICWRSFSSTLVPVTIVCGHSFCNDCSENLKKCPMCRRRLSTGYQRVTNYSLLSLVERLGNTVRKETKDQEVQTDIVQYRSRKKTIQSSQAEINGLMIDNPPRTKSKQIVIKFIKEDSGQFRGLEVKFK